MKWSRPVWSRWKQREAVTLEEFVALSMDAEPEVRRAVSWPPAPPPTRAEYEALVSAIENGTPAPADQGPSSVSWAFSWKSEEGDARIQQLRAAIHAGELPPGSAGATDQTLRWPLRALAQWAARAGWDVPDGLADLGVFTTLELVDLLANPGPSAGNPWTTGDPDETMRRIDRAALSGKLIVRHPVDLTPVDASEWPQPSSGQLVVRWSDVQAWRHGTAAAAPLPPQQRHEGPEAAPAVAPRGADVSHAAADAPVRGLVLTGGKKTRNERDDLAPLIRKVFLGLGEPESESVVMAELCRLAKLATPPSPLVGVAGLGLAWRHERDAENPRRTLTTKALGLRLDRLRAALAKERDLPAGKAGT